MKTSKFSEAQIAYILRQAEEGTAIGEVCRKAGISEATFYNWRKKYGGLLPSEMKRLKQLEDENSKLKRLLADAMLDASALRELLAKKMVRPTKKRLMPFHRIDTPGTSTCCRAEQLYSLQFCNRSNK